ncbi:MAG: hypothetical protein FWC48_00035 [Actinomycetia bacterium]|nr:hypothetical protein [Actinomycetes bacterium]
MAGFRDEQGQMVPELALVIPVFAIALVMVVNVLCFVSECARFDRVCDEVARVMSDGRRDPSEANALLQAALGYPEGSRGPFKAQVQAQPEGVLGLHELRLSFSLEYRVFASSSGTGGLGTWRRTKTLVVVFCQPLTEL